ncbi:MAG: AAA family ATPase [bacterium]
MAKLIMGIGVPGSGKTTILKPFAEENSYTYISPDDIRFEMLGDATEQSKNKEVWEEAHRRTADALRRGETVVFDATFAKDFERKEFIRFAREHGASKVQGMVAAVPMEVALERNRLREPMVPEHAIRRMHNMLIRTPPVVEDGFDSVFDIGELQQLKRAETRGEHTPIIREFKKLR